MMNDISDGAGHILSSSGLKFSPDIFGVLVWTQANCLC